MAEPQLSVRSTKARDLAHALARRTGQPINKLVERALDETTTEWTDLQVRFVAPERYAGQSKFSLKKMAKLLVPMAISSK